MRTDLLIAGVGGQGTVLASRVIATAAINAGFPAFTSETIGMAQREGCVLSHVRIGDSSVGPLIPMRSATGLIAFEPAEAVRAKGFFGENMRALVNTRPIAPVTASLGQTPYHYTEILDYLRTLLPEAVMIDAGAIAMEAGGLKFTNTVMLGAAAAARIIDLPQDSLLQAIEQLVPGKYLEANIKAFELGTRL